MWNYTSAKHLLSRTLFGYTKEEIDFASSISMDDFVDNFLLQNSEILKPGEWVDEDPSEGDGEHNIVFLDQLTKWYLSLIFNASYSIQERMVLYLHNHFTTEARKVWQIQRIYHQNQLLRSYSLGNFRELTKKITIDTAMLDYLDGKQNSKSDVNENYSRELLELFTIGIGNYTQEDVKQGALGLTGWRVPPTKLFPTFDENWHYKGKITYLGKKDYFDYIKIVDTIFEKLQTSISICNKLCKEYICPNPNPDFVHSVAEIFLFNNFELKPVLSYIFKSDYFFSADVRAVKIKSPLEFLIGTVKLLGVKNLDYSYIKSFSNRLDQEIFNPPDVRGWEGQRKWINSTTFSIRAEFIDLLIDKKDIQGNLINFEFDIIQFARKFESSDRAAEFVEEISNYLFQFTLSVNNKNYLLDFLLEGQNEEYWSTYSGKANERLQKFIKAALKLPEFQLH